MRRVLVITIALSIIFAGCTIKDSEPAANGPSITILEDNQSGKENETGRQVAMGRYVETDITPPQATGNTSNIWMTDAGIVCQIDHYSYCISSDGGNSWTTMDTSWMNAIDYEYMSIIFIEDDGTIWVKTSNKALIDIGLWRIDPNASPHQIAISEDICFINVLRALPGDRFLAQYDVIVSGSKDSIETGIESEPKAGVFSATSGELLYPIELTFLSVIPMEFFTNNDEFVFFTERAGQESFDLTVTVIRISDGALVNKYANMIPVDALTIRDYYFRGIEVDQDNLFYVNNQGLNRIGLGGSLSEIILETGRYSFQGHSMEVGSFLAAPDDTFYIISRDSGNNSGKPARLFKYTYDNLEVPS